MRALLFVRVVRMAEAGRELVGLAGQAGSWSDWTGLAGADQELIGLPKGWRGRPEAGRTG